MEKREIVIAGAGLAGLVAGINLAKAGYEVIIFEKNKDCGERFEGDLEGFENWSRKLDVLEDLKSMNIDLNFYCEPFRDLKVYDYKLDCTKIKSERTFFYLVKRGNIKDSLDNGLKKQALDSGVKIKFGTLAKEEDVDIVATGPSGADAVAKGIIFDTEMEDVVVGFLDDDIAPKGYAYLIINKGHGCLVTGMFRHFHLENEYYKRMREKVSKVIDLKITNVKEFGGYGNFFLERRYVYNGKIHLGECAGLQDFLWGFGMRYAISSGYLAAKSIIENKDFEVLMKKRFDSQLKTSLVNRFLFERLGNKGYRFIVKKVKKNNKPIEFLYKYYNPSFLKKILLPFAKLVMGSKKDKHHRNCECSWCRSRKQEYD